MPLLPFGAAPGLSKTNPTATGTLTINGLTTEASLGGEQITAANDRTFAGANNWVGTNWTTSGGAFVHTAGINSASLANSFLTATPIAGTNYQVTFDVTTTTAGVLTPSFGGLTSGLITLTVNSGASTITRSSGSFITDGFAVDNNVNFTGFSNAINNNTFQIATLTATVMTVTDLVGLVSEGPTANCTVQTTTGIGVGQLVGTLTAQTQIINATGTGALAFTPNAAWTGSIDNISVKIVTASAVTEQLKNSDGTSAVQIRSGGSNGTDLQDTYVGFQAGFLTLNTTAGFNTGIGAFALASVTSGASNTGVGNVALASTTTGSNNSGIGDNAGAALTTGNRNNAQGSEALGSMVYGSDNTAMGDNAMQFVVGGDQNTAMGAQALASSTNMAFSGSVALGYQAGYWSTANNQFWVDNTQRTDLATAKANALMYGVFGAAAINQTLAINGRLDTQGRSISVATKTTSYALTGTDEVILADATSGSVTMTLPTAATKAGQTFTVKKKDSSANTVTIATTGGQTIDGSSNAVISVQGVSITVVSDSVNWYII